MRKTVMILAGIATLWILPLVASAQSGSLLTKEQEKALPKAAQADYQAAVKHMDKIDYAGVLVSLTAVQQKAPQDVPVRLAIARLAVIEARKASGDTPKAETDCGQECCWRLAAAKDRLDMAQKALSEIMDMEKNGVPIKKDDATLAEGMLHQVKSMLDNLSKRNESRETLNKAMFAAYKKDLEDAAKKAGGSTVPAGAATGAAAGTAAGAAAGTTGGAAAVGGAR